MQAIGPALTASFLEGKFQAALEWQDYLATDPQKAAPWRAVYERLRLTPEQETLVAGFSRQVNLETIHTHDVLAERFGTVGELRRELEHGGPLEHHTGLDEWLSRS